MTAKAKSKSSQKQSRRPKLIGVIHLPPLAGAPKGQGEHPFHLLQEAGLRAVQEAQQFEKLGFDGLILENFNDAPFYRSHVPPETLASMAIIAGAVREATDLKIGINVLRNDSAAALSIAAVTGCDFIRVNVLSGVAATDQGMIEGSAAELLRDRERLSAQNVEIFADAQVKHAQPLSSKDLAYAISDLVERAMANAVLITGPTTGRAVDRGDLGEAVQICQDLAIPLYIASGVSSQNIAEVCIPGVHGIIIGSDLRVGGRAGAPLDLKRTKTLMKAFEAGTSQKTQKSRKFQNPPRKPTKK